jgi:hypothetical protein
MRKIGIDSTKDGRLAYILKSIYLLPILLICYLPVVIYAGIKEVGGLGVISAWKRAKENDRRKKDKIVNGRI